MRILTDEVRFGGNRVQIVFRVLYWLPRAAVAKCQKLGGLKQWKYTIFILGSRRPRFKVLAGPCCLCVRREFFLASSRFWCLQAIPWHSLACGCLTQSDGCFSSVCPHIVFLLCLSPCPNFPFL